MAGLYFILIIKMFLLPSVGND